MCVCTCCLENLLSTLLLPPVCVCVSVCVHVCSNYGRADLSKRRFVKLVSQLDDNIMYLCMAQVGEVCAQ